MSTMHHILVVDDHRDIRDLIGRHLQQHNYRVSLAESAEAARSVLAAGAIDLIVLDIMMPGEDGLSLCRYLREHTEIPVILLTALSEETDRIVGLEMGADDYLTKPFSTRELLARLKSVLRRTHAMPPQRQTLNNKILRFDRWQLDTDLRELSDAQGVVVPLSSAEFSLLLTFLEHPRRVLNRDQLLDLTQGRSAKLFDRSIDNQVSRLRKKIEKDAKKPELIATVWGGGYQFNADVEPKQQ